VIEIVPSSFASDIAKSSKVDVARRALVTYERCSSRPALTADGALNDTSAVEISKGHDFAALRFSTVHMKMGIAPEFISIGGNRNPAAADWDQDGPRLLAFGADNSIAVWEPEVWNSET
jgi:hypothetical protein